MNIIKKVMNKINRILGKTPEKVVYEDYYNKYQSYSFADGACTDEKQFEASITRLYHTVEKGLSYLNYRPGFGKENVLALVKSMEQYSRQYGVDKFFYQTALSVLNEYAKKNENTVLRIRRCLNVFQHYQVWRMMLAVSLNLFLYQKKNWVRLITKSS